MPNDIPKLIINQIETDELRSDTAYLSEVNFASYNLPIRMLNKLDGSVAIQAKVGASLWMDIPIVDEV